ncbi:hypothetical protein [Microbacterium sp.]|uniref:hypothetical protein n=1 Tax=Microbacterium sp. TaxID=51671 RepID=UPI003221C1C1
MDDTVILVIGLGLLLAAGWLALAAMFGILQLISYWSIRPAKPQAFAQRRHRQRHLRETIVPAVAALVTGLLVSVSATYFVRGLDGIATAAGRTLFAPALLFLLLAGLLLAVLLPVLLRLNANLYGTATTPDLIGPAADALPGAEPDPRGAWCTLVGNYREWWRFRGSYAFGSRPQRTPPVRLNRALRVVPRDPALPLRLTWRMLSWSLIVSSVRSRPLQFGWVALPTVLLPVGIIAFYATGELIADTPAEPFESAAWGIAVALALNLFYWWTLLVSALRTHAARLEECGRARAALRDAKARIDEHEAREAQLDQLIVQQGHLLTAVQDLRAELATAVDDRHRGRWGLPHRLGWPRRSKA